MHLVYNSDNFYVVQFAPIGVGRSSSEKTANEPSSTPIPSDQQQATQWTQNVLDPTKATHTSVGSFEIVDKLIGKGIYLEGVLADNFTKSIVELMEKEATQDDIEALLEGFCAIGSRKLLRN